jgi:hypothetical protein
VLNGILYAGEHAGFLYHAWAEGRITGCWIAVVPAFGQLPADASHLKPVEVGTARNLVPLIGLIGRINAINIEAAEPFRRDKRQELSGTARQVDKMYRRLEAGISLRGGFEKLKPLNDFSTVRCDLRAGAGTSSLRKERAEVSPRCHPDRDLSPAKNGALKK